MRFVKEDDCVTISDAEYYEVLVVHDQLGSCFLYGVEPYDEWWWPVETDGT